VAATTTAADGPGLVAEDRRCRLCSMLDPRQWLEPHCSFCGTFTGPFSDVEGLLTMLICIPCLAVRQAQPDTLLALHDPGQPWLKWGCPIDGCGQ
jgi:hypothetical protein